MPEHGSRTSVSRKVKVGAASELLVDVDLPGAYVVKGDRLVPKKVEVALDDPSAAMKVDLTSSGKLDFTDFTHHPSVVRVHLKGPVGLAKVEELGASEDDEPTRTSRDPLTFDEYAAAVADRVKVLVRESLADAPDGVLAAPSRAVAEAMVDLVIGSTGTPEQQMAEYVAPLWSAQRAREALDLARSTMGERRKTGTLLGVQTSDGQFFYPLFQFEKREGKVRVRPGLAEFFKALRGEDPWAVAMMANTEADELEGLSPVEWVREGRDHEGLLDYASVLRSEWS